jgi:hypothetical protein
MKDISRNKLEFELYCSKHPKTRLTISHDLSRIGANSAYEVNLNISVHPCMECAQEFNHLEYIIKSIKEIQSIDLKEDNQ